MKFCRERCGRGRDAYRAGGEGRGLHDAVHLATTGCEAAGERVTCRCFRRVRSRRGVAGFPFPPSSLEKVFSDG